MKTTQTILDEILVDVRQEVAAAKALRPLAELHRMVAVMPPVRSLSAALRSGFGLIAEIKERSPSQGEMRKQNVAEAAAAYERSKIVRAVSVLTNRSHFGMGVEWLIQTKCNGTKPVLRKDFIFYEYQVYEARAFGADAILLMANLLEADEMKRLYAVTRELGMDALFECHDREQIAQVPAGAVIYGINSRTFAVGSGQYAAARAAREDGVKLDFTTDLSRFDIGQHLPSDAVKVAESGIHPSTIAVVRDEHKYHAALVGTSLLTAEQGIEKELAAFERALEPK